jgi:hypothetical protein
VLIKNKTIATVEILSSAREKSKPPIIMAESSKKTLIRRLIHPIIRLFP